jgi:hypothetical protein
MHKMVSKFLCNLPIAKLGLLTCATHVSGPAKPMCEYAMNIHMNIYESK